MTKPQNGLILSLPADARRSLLAACEPVELRLSDVLYEPSVGIRQAYFPVDAFVSLIACIDSEPGVEVGMVGREGMVGSALVLGMARAPVRALVQGAGSAWRIDAEPLGAVMAAHPDVKLRLDRYVSVLMAQQITASACLRFHQIGPRLARWLLMSQDRAHADRFRITHEFIAYMLGVRRVGITCAAGRLQRRGLIHYRRGEITVVDRPGLEAAACSCYAADRAFYSSALGGLRRAVASPASSVSAATPASGST